MFIAAVSLHIAIHRYEFSLDTLPNLVLLLRMCAFMTHSNAILTLIFI